MRQVWGPRDAESPRRGRSAGRLVEGGSSLATLTWPSPAGLYSLRRGEEGVEQFPIGDSAAVGAIDDGIYLLTVDGPLNDGSVGPAVYVRAGPIGRSGQES